jgi:hypothetical protein
LSKRAKLDPDFLFLGGFWRGNAFGLEIFGKRKRKNKTKPVPEFTSDK